MSPSSWGRLSMVPTALAGPVSLLASWMGLCLGKKSLPRTGLGRLNAHQQYNQIRSRPHSNRSIFFGEGWCSGKFRECRGKMLISGLSSITAQTKLSTLSRYRDLSGQSAWLPWKYTLRFPSKRKLPVGTVICWHMQLRSQDPPQPSRQCHPLPGMLPDGNWTQQGLPAQHRTSLMGSRCPGAPITGQHTQLHRSLRRFLLNPLSSSLSSRRCQNSIALCRSPCLLPFLLPCFFTGMFPHKALDTNFHLSCCFSEDLNWHGQCVDVCYVLPTPYIFPLLIGMQSPHKPNHLIGELLFFNPKHGVMVDCEEDSLPPCFAATGVGT